MSRDDVRNHIIETLKGEQSAKETEETDEETQVEIQKAVCIQCGTVDCREPRPLDVWDIKTDCDTCGEVTVHEWEIDSEETEA